MNEIPANEIPVNEIRTNGIQMNDIRKLLAAAISPEQKTAILGCGSILRGDDAAGCRIAERLSGLDGNAKAFYGGNAPENLTGEIKRFCPDMLLVIDAAGLEQPPGTVALVPPESVSGATFSTHMLPLNVMLNYLQRETGCGVRLLGIQAASLASGTEMTPAVNAAVDMIVSVLLELLGKQ